MPPDTDALKKKFREGRHAQAIAECEALCARHPARADLQRLCANMHALTGNFARSLALLLPLRDAAREDPDLLFNIAMCERELQHFDAARDHFELFTKHFPDSADGWASLAECEFQRGDFQQGAAMAGQALQRDAASLAALTVLGHCQKALRQYDQALESYGKAMRLQPSGETCFHAGQVLAEIGQPAQALAHFDQAIGLAPRHARLRVARGDTLQGMGRVQEAVADYKVALELAPSDEDTLKKVSMCLLEAGQGEAAIALCRDILRAHPDNLTARLGADWVLSQLVPLWHIPMMNEQERNQAFHDGLAAVVTPEKLVFEIGTGSGLLAMMAARLGAQQVVTCEAVDLVAATARRIVERNGYQRQVTVLGKPSHAVDPARDLPRQADLLVHEIFSSELLGEHVLPAIEDAKRRLLKPGGEILPSAASIMVALVGGDALGMNLHVGESFGFDLGAFNAIHPRKRPLYREDLDPLLMSDAVEAFRFDFANASEFPAESKLLQIAATTAGRCYGVIQWIRIELGAGIRFENHPARRRPVSNWQHTIYGFDEPLALQAGTTVGVSAMHDRSRPWFSLAAVSPA